ncbi:MAG: sodium:proton antiporter [Oscillospiraceae bacterium]|jgi:Na+/H+ antiporter NhaC|nr:sodium:proton antiporter [Oscillospiraceae bacterium]
MADKKKLEFYGGEWVSFLPFVVFLALIVVTTLMWGSISDGALWLPAFLALIIAFFFVKDKRHYAEVIIEGMASKEAITPVVCWLFAGVFSRILRSSGLAAAIAGLAAGIGVGPALFTVITFVAACLFATASGTGFGTIAAAMAVLYPAGVALGCHPGLLAGIIISGAIFGDNLAPVSDTTICSATSQGVDVPGVVRSRLKYAAVSAGVTIVIAVILSLVLGSNGIAMDANLSYDPMAFFMLIAVVITIVVAIKTGDIIIATTLGTVSGGVIGVLTGQFDFLQIDAADPAKGALIAVHGEGLDRTVDGILQTGLSSMLQVCILALLLFGSIAIMRAGGGDVRLLNALGSVAKTAKGAEVVTSFMVIILSTIMGLNAPAILAVGPSFAKPLSEKHGISPYRTANLLDAQSNTLVYAMPWVPGMIYTLSFASGTSAPLTAAQVTPFVIYGYVLLVVMFASIFLGIGRHDGEDRLAAKAR